MGVRWHTLGSLPMPQMVEWQWSHATALPNLTDTSASSCEGYSVSRYTD